MGFLLDQCTVFSHNGENFKFSCGDKDLDNFFLHDAAQWMLDPANKTACRHLTVDVYNNDPMLKFYEANGFKTIFSSETQEKEYMGLPSDKDLKTRLMYFDLILLKQQI